MQGRRALHPAQDYCHLCLHKRSALAHRREPANGQCSPPDPSLHLHGWRGNLPFPVQLGIPKDRIGNHDHHILERRQVYVEPSPYTVPEICSHPCYVWQDVRVPRWNTPMPPCTCVWQRQSERGCVRKWYHYELPHPFNNGPMPSMNRSQSYCREAQYVSDEQDWDCDNDLSEPERDNRHTRGYNGHCERKHVTFKDHNHRKICNSKEIKRQASPFKEHCNGTTAFFSTEVPQSKLGSYRTSATMVPVNRLHGGMPKLCQTERSEMGGSQESWKSQRKSQGAVREKIKQVVTELEDVLSGLKQVQVEMKEVVQQIDILTCNIDLGEEDEGPANSLLQDPRHQANRIGVVALIHNPNGDAESQQRDSALSGVESWTTFSLSDHGLSAAASTCSDSYVATKTHTNPSTWVHGLMTAESVESLNHTSMMKTHRTKSAANGDCLRTRPPSGKVKDSQHQRGRGDHAVISKIPEHPFPLASTFLAKSQKLPPYPPNGLLKMSPQDLHHPPNNMKMHHLPGKQKQLNTTIV